MKGYPKTLNTKEDYDYVKANFPKELWMPDYQKLLDSMKDWVPVGKIKAEDEGITDDTHKITEESSRDNAEKAYVQWELQEIPTCKLYGLGFTVEEVRMALGVH